MTRHVYPTAKIPHLWAHEQQDEARNPQGNLFFRNKTIYSYGSHFPIAKIVVVPRGENKGRKVVFFTTATSTVTTSGHINDARRAIPNYSVVHCYDPTVSIADVRTELTKLVRSKFTYFKSPLVGGYGASATKPKNKTQRLLAYRAFLEAADRLEQFSELFGYKSEIKFADNHDEIMAGLAEYDEAVKKRSEKLASTREERWARRDAARRAEWEEQERVRALAMEQRIALWRSGGAVAHYLISGQPTMLRIKDGNIETSQGVEFPVSHAKRVLEVVEKLLVSGKTYQANGHTIHLGHYQLDSIDEDGTVHAGCHHIAKDEVLRLIGELKAQTPVA